MSIIRGFFSRNLKSEKIIFSNTNIEESRQKRYNRFMIVNPVKNGITDL